jgi:hypothetical protein
VAETASTAPPGATSTTTLIDRYAGGTAVVLAALEAVGSARLDVADTDGWTARQVVHHLADSETRAYIRLRQLVAEDNARIEAYDEAEYARRLHYDRPIEAAVAVIRAVRASSLELLGLLAPADFERTGSHPEHEHYTATSWLEIYAAHPREHAEQMLRAAGVG